MKSGSMTEAQLAQAIRRETDVIQLADMLVEVGRQGFTALVPVVEAYNTHADEGVRGAVVKSLVGFMLSVPHMPLALQMLHADPSPEAQCDAAQSLQWLAAKHLEQLALVCEELAMEVKASSNSHVRQHCLAALGELYGKNNTRLPDGRKWKDAKQEIVEALAARAKARAPSV